MEFFKFMEAKFTQHSLAQKSENFSILADGEAKATQSYMHGARKLAKWWAWIKLPTHYVLCKFGIYKFPSSSQEQVAVFSNQKKIEAERTRELEASLKAEKEVRHLNPVADPK